MLEQLNQFDQNLFFAINHGLSNAFFDWLMPFLRNRFFWTPLYLFIVIFCIRNYGKQGWLLLVFLGLTFGVTDYSSSSIVKPAFQRLRPCNNPELKAEVNSLIACGSGYSFPSSHAANHFAIAFFLITMFYHKWKTILPLGIFWALSISFAQVYVGVHYPGDVLFGGLLGGMIGYVMGTILTNTSAFRTWKPGN
jgi:membrane-associated phospholipid phosphatase